MPDPFKALLNIVNTVYVYLNTARQIIMARMSVPAVDIQRWSCPPTPNPAPRRGLCRIWIHSSGLRWIFNNVRIKFDDISTECTYHRFEAYVWMHIANYLIGPIVFSARFDTSFACIHIRSATEMIIVRGSTRPLLVRSNIVTGVSRRGWEADWILWLHIWIFEILMRFFAPSLSPNCSNLALTLTAHIDNMCFTVSRNSNQNSTVQ